MIRVRLRALLHAYISLFIHLTFNIHKSYRETRCLYQVVFRHRKIFVNFGMCENILGGDDDDDVDMFCVLK